MSEIRSFQKTFQYLLLAAVFVCGLAAQAGPLRLVAAEERQDPGLSLVEVRTDSVVGNGILFILDGRLRVLTNAHITDGATNIQVKVDGIRTWSQVPVETSLTVDDLAVLVIPDQPDLRAIAEKTFQVCTSRAGGLCSSAAPSDIQDIFSNYSGEDKLVFFSRGWVSEARPQTSINGFRKVEDYFISGTYKYVWQIRALVKDGVSGGAYFHMWKFAALLTKISQGMQSTVIAIPAEEIARVLSENTASNASAPARVIRLAQKTGGDTGNGGGSLTESETAGAEPMHWSLSRMGCNGFQCESQAQIVNPFYDAATDTSIEVNGQKAAFIYQSNLVQFLFQSASTPRYNKFVAQKTKFKLFSLNDPVVKKLTDKRQTSFLELNHLRVWKKLAPGVLKNNYPATGAFNDGVINLSNVGKKLDASRRMYVGNFGPSIAIGVTDDTSLQVVMNDQDQRIVVTRDLSKIWVGNEAGTAGEFLVAQPLLNPIKRLFKSVPTAAQPVATSTKAVMVYNEADLKRLESLIVETTDYVYEFTLIEPNNGYSR